MKNCFKTKLVLAGVGSLSFLILFANDMIVSYGAPYEVRQEGYLNTIKYLFGLNAEGI